VALQAGVVGTTTFAQELATTEVAAGNGAIHLAYVSC
jgi:hypothetical protein